MSTFEMQGLTWKARSKYQQDAILIENKVIQHDGLISKLYSHSEKELWCVAVADGISNSPAADQAAYTVLSGLTKNRKLEPYQAFTIQQYLVDQLAHQKNSFGASSTLALIHNDARQGFVTIQHLGDSRVYLFSQHDQKWHCLTRDHNYLEQLRENGEVKEGENYASIYGALLQYFCADPLHEVMDFTTTEEYLTQHDALLVCTDGVHDVMECREWPPLKVDMELRAWLLDMKASLDSKQAYDNVSMVLVRAKI
ncbi:MULTISPECIES: PP2C family serine/threonine-protein phosphatase [unclassified Acinetobacter]|uniref:PP2C family protein-serine/threonine phosphatase n=1 Tax=unclassified Acinetobacter TaxID=196816 RepID=UPI0015D3F8F3|nr:MULTISPECIES: PP2C family serine/threonine-protein phosphatase [unclassified Acinetobacter]